MILSNNIIIKKCTYGYSFIFIIVRGGGFFQTINTKQIIKPMNTLKLTSNQYNALQTLELETLNQLKKVNDISVWSFNTADGLKNIPSTVDEYDGVSFELFKEKIEDISSMFNEVISVFEEEKNMILSNSEVSNYKYPLELVFDNEFDDSWINNPKYSFNQYIN